MRRSWWHLLLVSALAGCVQFSEPESAGDDGAFRPVDVPLPHWNGPTPSPTPDMTVLWFSDFETDDGGLDTVLLERTASTWAWGDPDGTARSGTNAWATGLDGTTAVDEFSCLVLPFSVPAEGSWWVLAYLRWDTHVATDVIRFRRCDAAGANCVDFFSTTGASVTPEWQAIEEPLAAVAGSSIQLQWCVDDSTFGGSVPTDGLYVDDVAIATSAAIYAITHPE